MVAWHELTGISVAFVRTLKWNLFDYVGFALRHRNGVILVTDFL